MWTREQRYRRLEEAAPEEIASLLETVHACPFRQTFHIQPPMGLMNDPNGLAYFDGYYHVFYQWFPLGPVHGVKYWYHMKSIDLITWIDEGPGIRPDLDFDSHGAYSGSALEQDGKLYLMYTGNKRDENWRRYPSQCIAVMNQNGEISKWQDPVIPEPPNGYTEHFRDPRVWKEDGGFWAIIGAQREDLTGTVLLYSSPDMKTWRLEGELKTNLPNFGYMWECPDYFELDNSGVLIFSPQGIEEKGDEFQNIYQSGYLIGETLNLLSREFHHGAFKELDRGFDFYAPQTMVDPNGRRILIGWMGLPEIDYPTDKNGWAHCLTIPRELSIQNGKLIQTPVKELEALRKQKVEIQACIENESKTFLGLTGTTFEMKIKIENLDAVECGIEFRANNTKKTVLKYEAKRKRLILDRSLSGESVGIDYGTIRACSLESELLTVHLFVDVSSVEIFINDGEEVFTARIFPEEDGQDIRFFANHGSMDMTVEKWAISRFNGQ